MTVTTLCWCGGPIVWEGTTPKCALRGCQSVPVSPVEEPTRDPIVAAVQADLETRMRVGIRKYGMTVAANPLTHRQWLQHAYEEALDMAVYLKRAMSEIAE